MHQAMPAINVRHRHDFGATFPLLRLYHRVEAMCFLLPGITRDLSMEKFDYSDIARTNVKYDGARPWDCQYLQAILVVGYDFLFA